MAVVSGEIVCGLDDETEIDVIMILECFGDIQRAVLADAEFVCEFSHALALT